MNALATQRTVRNKRPNRDDPNEGSRMTTTITTERETDFTRKGLPPVPSQRAAHEAHLARMARLFPVPRRPPVRIPTIPTARERAEALLREADEMKAWGDYAPVAAFDECIPPPPKVQPPRRPLSTMTAREIINQVCEQRRVDYREIIGACKTYRISHARAELYYRLREERQLSWSQIGKLMGGKDHTSVYHGYHKHVERMKAAGK